MAAKVFEVGDVLPATTRLRISWVGDILNISSFDRFIRSYDGFFGIVNVTKNNDNNRYIYIGDGIGSFVVIYNDFDFISPYTNYNGNHAYCDIDTSEWDISMRTISTVGAGMDIFTWEDLPPAPSGYTITFNSNGGTTISDIEDATELPTPLPTPTKSGYTFVAWYYESNFQTRAVAGATIEEDTTLYAKWHNLGSLFTEIANAIRSKDGTSENIRDVDFGERVKQIQGAKEEETKTVTPDFSSGNVVVTPTSGKVMTQVTINKDSNLIPENIKDGVTIFGVTGTLEPEPSGYDITFSIGEHASSSSTYDQFFSIDNGTTWTQLSSAASLLVDTLNNINMIKFKIKNAKIVIDDIVFADRLNNNSEFVTDNYTLTKDVDIYVGIGWLD